MMEISQYLAKIEENVVAHNELYEGITAAPAVQSAIRECLPLSIVTLRTMASMRERLWETEQDHYRKLDNSNCSGLADSVFSVFKQLALSGELKEVRFATDYFSEYHGDVISGVAGRLGEFETGEYVIVSGDWAEVFGGDKDIRGEPNKRVISRGINNPFGGIYAGNDGRNAHRILSVLTEELENRLLD
jgi:hypothetical protein